MPGGLTLAPGGGLSGTPIDAGNFTFTITATDENNFTGSQSYSMEIAPPEITLGPASLPAAIGGVEYGPVTLVADGGVGALFIQRCP